MCQIAVKLPPPQPAQGRTHFPPFKGGFEVDEADCTLKATRSHTTCRVALPRRSPHPEARQAPGSRPSLA